MRRHSAVTKLREILIQECREKESVDPRETDVNDSFHASVTLSIGEIRRFLIATATSSEELDLPTDHPHFENGTGEFLARKAIEYAALEKQNAELRAALEDCRMALLQQPQRPMYVEFHQELWRSITEPAINGAEAALRGKERQ